MTFEQQLVARYSDAHKRLMNPPPKPIAVKIVKAPDPPPKVELLVPTKRPILELSPVISRSPRIHEILRLVSEREGLHINQLVGRRRYAPYVLARYIFYYICYHYTRYSLTQIGKAVGGKDHTTVLHGIRVIARRLKDDELWRVRMERLLEELRNSIPAIHTLTARTCVQCPVCSTQLILEE